MVKLVDLSHQWAIEIGRVFIAFGSIEYITHECLRTVPRDAIYEATNKMLLAPRIDLLLALLASLREAKAIRLALLLRRAKELAEHRNLIAHNPLGLDLYVTEEGEKTVRESIRSLRNKDKVLTFAQLVELRAQCESLVTELFDAQAGLLEELREARRSEES
jgi:hypothetical protein